MGRFGQGYLGEIGSRLQRLLGFDGEAGASFTSEAVPVMIVGDATLPGYGNAQGRRFVLNSGLVAAGAFFYWRATADVIITRIRYTNTLAAVGQHDLRLIDPTTAPGVAPAAGGNFLDRSISINDRPPLEFYNNPAATAGTVIVSVVTSAASPGIGTFVDLIPEPFCMSPGMQMGILNNAAGSNPRFELWGQTL